MHAADTAAPRLINPMAEDAHWRRSFTREGYYRTGLVYDDYGPAFRVGYTGPLRREGSFADLEPALQRDWEAVKGRSRLAWSEARQAVRAAWERVTEAAQQPA